MLKLPVCPYCHTVYSYGEVRKNHRRKAIRCYHCKNDFRQSRNRGYFVLGTAAVIFAVVINIIILNMVSDIVSSIMPIVLVSLFAVVAALLLTPFFTAYVKEDGEKPRSIPPGEILDEEKLNRKMKRSVKAKLKKTDKNS